MRVRYMLLCRLGLLLALLVGVLTSGTSRAQSAYQPEFDVDVVSVRGDKGRPALDIYTAIPYSNLRFRARTGGFEADYTVAVEVHRVNSDGDRQGLVHARSWEREVSVGEYAATQSHERLDKALQSLPVTPGRYAIEVQVEDGASRRTFSRETALVVGDAVEGLAMSTPLLIDRYDAGSKTLFPNVGGTIRTDQEAFTIFYDIYAEAASDLRVTYVATEQNRVRERPSFRALLGLASREQADTGTPLILSEKLAVRTGRNPATLRVETERFRVGDYLLSVRLETEAGRLVAETHKPFSVRWMGLEGQISDIEEAIAQLRYIARDRDIRAMRRAETPGEKLRLFRAFWERRDPTPGTHRNERMEEYFYRIAYANERYSRMRDEGWNTDRGEVFVRFGEPDAVERHPFNYGTKPYEIWYYQRHGRRFVFVDDTGMGDWRLLVPIWDDRTRM